MSYQTLNELVNIRLCAFNVETGYVSLAQGWEVEDRQLASAMGGTINSSVA